nr:hypothetical protein [Tanacetum cinerariifolium]
MDMTIDQQVALDEALVPHECRLMIGKRVFRLRSDITSKESTLQVVYDVLRLTPFYKAFLVISDVLEIYMQEFWATATVHHHSIRFKMNNKKRIVNLEYFREMLHIFEHKDAKKSNEMYYLRFTKVIINFFMTKDPSIPRRNKFGAMLPVELTNEDIRNSAAYKEYYAIASGAAPLKTKASVRKTQSSFDTAMPPLTAAGTRLSTSAKGKQPAKSSKAKDEETGIIPGVLDVPTYESDKEISWKSSDEDDDDDVDDQSDADDDEQVDKDKQDDDDQDDNNDDQDSDNDGDDFIHPKLSTHDEEAKDEESFDPIVQTPSQVENSNDDESYGMNVGGDKGLDAKDDDEELYRDVNINLEGIDSLFESTYWVDVLVTTTVVLLLVTAPTLPPPSIPIISQVQQAPDPSPATAPSTSLYIDHQMNEVIKVALQLQSDRLQDEAQAENEDFLNKLDENIQKIIKEKVKVQVFKILPKIEKTVNGQLEAKVLTRASNSSKTSYVVAADLSKLEVKKILIEKIENNKSIHRSDEHRNLYKALVDAYECDKIILDTYGDMVTFKRRHDDEDKDEEPFAGSDRGLREDEHVKSQSQPVLQRKRHLRPLESLLKGLNLIKRLQASLHQ